MPTPDNLFLKGLSGLTYFGTDFSGWPYYLLSGLFFISCGLVTGYIIWRKGHMQTLDVESEVRDTTIELIKLRKDLMLEEEELNAGRDGNAAMEGKPDSAISSNADQKAG